MRGARQGRTGKGAGQGKVGRVRWCEVGQRVVGGAKSLEVMEGGKKGDTRDKVSLKYCLKRPGGGSISVIFTVTLMKAFWG